MANPHHVEIANELIEAFARTNLTSHESRVLWCIIRQTYGWNKEFDRISYSQFETKTGIDRRHIGRSIASLKTRNIIVCQGEGYFLEYGVQKDYENWDKIDTISGNDLPPSEATIENNDLTPRMDNLPPSQGLSVPSEVSNLPPSEVYTKDSKDSIQKTITKDSSHLLKTVGGVSPEEFEEYFMELKERFPGLDFEIEFEKFWLFWTGSRRKLKKPKLAFLNWIVKAQQIQEGNRKNGIDKNNNTQVRDSEGITARLKASIGKPINDS